PGGVQQPRRDTTEALVVRSQRLLRALQATAPSGVRGAVGARRCEHAAHRWQRAGEVVTRRRSIALTTGTRHQPHITRTGTLGAKSLRGVPVTSTPSDTPTNTPTATPSVTPTATLSATPTATYTPVSAGEQFVYVANECDDTISVIDTVTRL